MDETRTEERGLTADEVADEDAAALPNREAMSLIGGGLFDTSLLNDPSVMQQPTPTDGAALPAGSGLDDTALPLKNPFVN